MPRMGTAVPNLGLKIFGPVTVGTSAAVLVASTVNPNYAAFGGLTLYANSDNSESIYIGDETVTTSNGLPIAPGTAVTLQNNAHPSTVYAICASGGQVLRIVGS